ncbi:TPA: DUF4158 domain-containing protein, partial [Legionella pneumophila]
MTAIHETAYPRLKPHLTMTELEKNFSPTYSEKILMEESTWEASITNKLGFMILLKCYQCLGYAISKKNVPDSVMHYIGQAIGTAGSVNLAHYTSSSRKRHRRIILKYLEISDDEQKQRYCIKQSALKSAIHKESLADIINDMIETLIKERFELPGFSTLERMARAARVLINRKLYAQITKDISDESKNFLDTLFDATLAPDNTTSQWAFLKQEMQSPTTKNVNAFIKRLKQLQEWRSKAPATINDIPAHRLEQFIEEATALDSSDMKSLRQDKRYALAATMLYFKLATGLDDIASVIIRWLRKMRHEARLALDEYALSKKAEVDNLIGILYGVLLASNSKGTSSKKLQAIQSSLPEDKDIIIEQCQRYLSYSGDNYLPFMIKLYQNKRYVLFQLLEQLSLRSASQDKSIEHAVTFILQHRKNKQKMVSIVAQDFDQLSWLSDKWFNFVTHSKRHDEIMVVNKKHFELAVFNQLSEEIHCGDMYLEGANNYDDPNKQLISWEDFDNQVEPYCELIKQSSNASEFIKSLQKQHFEAAKRTDSGFVANEY